MTHRTLIVAVGLAVSVGRPAVGASQDFTKVFTEIDRVAVFGLVGKFSPAGDVLTGNNSRSLNRYGQAGLGIELGYNIRRPEDPRSTRWFYEGGIGYTQISGFRLVRDDVDLRGSIRELPTLSFYGIRKTNTIFNPYYGVSSGFAKLQNVNLYDAAGTQYTATAETFTVGGSIGVALANPAFSPFVEVGYRLRDFRSLDYKTSSTLALPATLPRSLNFSGWHLDVGLQVGLDKLKSPKP